MTKLLLVRSGAKLDHLFASGGPMPRSPAVYSFMAYRTLAPISPGQA